MKSTAQHKKIWHDAALLCATLLCLVAMAAAWFITSHQVDTSGMSMAAMQVLEGQLSLDGKEYLDNGEEKGITLPETLALTPISGNGITFCRPQTDPYTGDPLTTSNGSWKLEETEPTKDVDYLTFDIYAHASQASTLYMDGQSTLEAVKQATGDAIQTAVEKMLGSKADGDADGETDAFTAAFYAGAARVAFLDVTDEATPHLLTTWVPNQTYQLSQSITDGTWSLNKSGDPEDSYTYYDAKQGQEITLTTAQYITTADDTTQYKIVDLTRETTPKEPAYPYTAHIRVVVWIEGTDREAMAPQIPGGIALNLALRLAPNELS